MKLWPFLLAFAGLAMISDSPSPTDRKRQARARLLALARAELGADDPGPYWLETIGPDPRYWPEDWCGGFVLAMLKRAGIAPESWRWVVGHGFLRRDPMRQLPRGVLPEPGDVAYFDRKQHHAIVESVNAEARTFTTIDGNSTGGKVARNEGRPLSSVAAFFSIDRLI